MEPAAAHPLIHGGDDQRRQQSVGNGSAAASTTSPASTAAANPSPSKIASQEGKVRKRKLSMEKRKVANAKRLRSLPSNSTIAAQTPSPRVVDEGLAISALAHASISKSVVCSPPLPPSSLTGADNDLLEGINKDGSCPQPNLHLPKAHTISSSTASSPPAPASTATVARSLGKFQEGKVRKRKPPMEKRKVPDTKRLRSVDEGSTIFATSGGVLVPAHASTSKSAVSSPPRPAYAKNHQINFEANLDASDDVCKNPKEMEKVLSRRQNVPRDRLDKAPDAKRLRSPVVPMAVKSTGVKIMLSPKINSPSAMLPSTSQATRRRRLKSEIWKEFQPIYDGLAVAEAQCLHCHKLFKVNRDVGTSACLRHLRSCEGKAKLDQMLNQMSSTGLSLPEPSLKDWKFDQDVSRNELVKLISVHALPFSLVEYPKFRSFVSSLNPWFTHISRTTIKSDCIYTYESSKKKLREWLSQSASRVSLTADLWTSKQTLGYLCVTCHFITADWKIYKKIINFGLVETPHDGRNLFKALLKCLSDWNLENKVFAITLDNAGVNDNFVKSLKENLLAKRFLLAKGAMFHCRCGSHVFNLVVQEGLNGMSDAVTSIRESVKYVRSSQGRKQRFEKLVEELGIPCKKRPPLDVSTRWNSTYHMLNIALEYVRVFESLATEDIQYSHQPLLEEWDMARKLCNILGVFCTATEVVSGSKYPTASLYFHQVWEVKKVLERESSSTDMFIATMVHEMQKKLQKYWDFSFLQICLPVVLDPRFKLGFLKFRLEQGFEDEASTYLLEVQKTLKDLFDEYSELCSDLIPEYAKSINQDETVGGTDNPWADWGQHQNLKQRKRVSELDKYLEEDTVPVDAEFDILQYWKMSSATYPILACMARDMLAIPASTVASESAFSSGERIISDYRSRLSSETAEALVCLQDWLRQKDCKTSSTYDDIAGIPIGDDEDNEM